MNTPVIKPAVLLFTGLSGAGKSTIATGVYDYLQEKGIKSELLDGDEIRKIFPQTGFSKEERDRHIRRIGFLASMLERNGITVVASFIAPYKESRDFIRNICENYIEVYISTPIEICKQRDPKGYYARALRGEIKFFTGIDDPYEPPESPELFIDTSDESIPDSIGRVTEFIDRNYQDAT